LPRKQPHEVTIIFHKRRQDSHIVRWGVASHYSNLLPRLHSYWHATRFDPSGGRNFSPVFPFYRRAGTECPTRSIIVGWELDDDRASPARRDGFSRDLGWGGYQGHDLIGLGPERLAFLYSVQNEFNNLAARVAKFREPLYQNIY